MLICLCVIKAQKGWLKVIEPNIEIASLLVEVSGHNKLHILQIVPIIPIDGINNVANKVVATLFKLLKYCIIFGANFLFRFLRNLSIY